MTKRRAIVISIIFHAVLLTVLAVYLIPTPIVVVAKPDEKRIIMVEVEVPPPPKPPEKDPPPPIRTAKNIVPSTVPPIPLPPNDLDPEEFTGPVNPETIFDPPSPAPTKRVSPDYPIGAIKDDVSGSVIAVLTIGPDGSVVDVEIVSATPEGYFERAAKKALKAWRYPPQMVTAVSTGGSRKVTVEIEFNLEDASPRRR